LPPCLVHREDALRLNATVRIGVYRPQGVV
jgi:hypothetical protein